MQKIYLYDVHTHTNMDPMINEVDRIVNDCAYKNIAFNVIGTNLKDSIIAVEQAKKYPNVYATIGIHPSDVKDLNDIEKLEQLYIANKDVIVAIGEIGLDYHEEHFDKDQQKLFFKKQLELAEKLNLPVCIHVRDAEEDCLQILKQFKNPKKIWIHCFAKGLELAKRYINLGYMISIPGIITFKNAKEINEAILSLPLDRIMVETDGPWLAPVPHRGETNYPYYVEHIIDYMANKLQINKVDLAKKITENSVKFFGIKDIF